MSQKDKKASVIITEVDGDDMMGQYAVAMHNLDNLAQGLYMAGALIGAIMEESDDPGTVMAALAHVLTAASTGYLSKRAFDPFSAAEPPKFDA
jgi:hypothetical protein